MDEHGLLQNAMTNQHLHSLYINKMTSLEDRQSTKSHPRVPRAKNDKFYKEKYNKTDTNLMVCPKWKNGLSTAMIRNEQAHDNKRSGRYCFFEGRLQRNIVF